jgi:tRNA(Ile)-lysidine synthase
VHPQAQGLLTYIRRKELLRPGERVGVAVSGGIDSVALLRVLLELRGELGIVLSVVHFNHKLRGAESEADHKFVAGLAREFGLEFFVESGDVARHAAREHRGVEASARELRYGFFQRLFGAARDLEDISSSGGAHGTAEAAPLSNAEPSSSVSPQILLDKIATGHTLDDQAETVLMRVIRGTGMRGLGGIHPRILLWDDNQEDAGEESGEIIRPLLTLRRSELEKYLGEINQPWREDSTNADSKFTRNRLRKLVLPLLEREFNPAIVEGLTELAEIAQDEEDYWENEVSGWLGTVVQWSEPEWRRELPEFGGSEGLIQIGGPQPVDEALLGQLEESGNVSMNALISRPWLLTEPKAVQRRVLKAVGEQAQIPLEFKHIEEILRFAAEDGPEGKELSLPLGWTVVREPAAIVFVTPDLRRQESLPDYEYELPVPGSVFIPALGGRLEALLLPPEADSAGYNPQQLLRAEALLRPLVVRNWRAGDRYWPAHTKAAKKVKELLQKLHLPQSERKRWPVVLSGQELVWMRAFSVPSRFRASCGEQAVLIREVLAESDGESS